MVKNRPKNGLYFLPRMFQPNFKRVFGSSDIGTCARESELFAVPTPKLALPCSGKVRKMGIPWLLILAPKLHLLCARTAMDEHFFYIFKGFGIGTHDFCTGIVLGCCCLSFLELEFFKWPSFFPKSYK